MDLYNYKIYAINMNKNIKENIINENNKINLKNKKIYGTEISDTSKMSIKRYFFIDINWKQILMQKR